jgi:hypothetical protein
VGVIYASSLLPLHAVCYFSILVGRVLPVGMRSLERRGQQGGFGVGVSYQLNRFSRTFGDGHGPDRAAPRWSRFKGHPSRLSCELPATRWRLMSPGMRSLAREPVNAFRRRGAVVGMIHDYPRYSTVSARPRTGTLST